mgnify:CR=1 FL=1
MKSKVNAKSPPCPRCSSPLWLVSTEFRFYVPHCVICGFEDYNRTTRQSGLSVEDLYKANTTETDTGASEVA